VRARVGAGAIAALAIALVAVSCGGTHRRHDPAFIPDGYHAYSSSEMSYGLALPPGWRGGPDSSVEDVDALFNPTDAHSPGVTVSRSDAPDGLTTLGAVEDVLRRAAYNGVQAARGEDVFVDGMRSAFVLTAFNEGGANPTGRENAEVTFVKSGHQWRIVLLAVSGARADALPMFRLIVASFKSD
jgi:hypothetical protein